MGRREDKSKQTKTALVECGLRLFREKGYDAVTVEEITRAAGVAKGTFYSYFDVKSDIIVEEFWEIDRYYSEYAERNLQRFESPTKKLTAFTRAQMRYVRDTVGYENLKILYVNQILQTGEAPVIINPGRQWYRIVAGIIEEGQQIGIFRDDHTPNELAHGFNRAMRSVLLDWCITDAAFDLVKEALTHLQRWALPALSDRSSQQ